MKQKITLFKVLLTLMLLCGVGSVWGETAFYTLSFTKLTSGTNYNSYTGAHSITCDKIDWSLYGNQSLGNYIRVGGKNTTNTDRTFTSNGSLNKSISKISINHNGIGNGSNSSITINSITVEGSTSSSFSANKKSKTISNPSVSAGTLDFVLDDGNWDADSYYRITVNYKISGSNNCYITINSIDFYEAPQSSVATPIIDPANGPFLNSATATMSCATEGATIYYTTDESTPTNSSNEYTAPITVTETTIFKAVAYKDGEYSSVVTATYTKITPFTSMDAVFDASGTAGNYWITFDKWVVSGVKGNNAYLTDNKGKGLIIYKNGHGFAANDVLSGTVNCALTKYNGSAEITSLSATSNNLTVTHDGTLNTIETTIANLGGVNTGAYVDLGTLTYDGTNFSDGTNTIKPYNTFITLPTLNNGVKYKVKGMYMQFGDTKEIAPLTADDFEEIPATKYEINIDELTNGTITASAEEAVEGAEISLTITPNVHYALKDGSLVVLNETTSDEITVTNNKFTMPASNVLVSAEFVELPKHTVIYSVLGEYAGDEEVYDGETIANAPTPDGFDGWTFAGWTTNDNYAMSTTAPVLFTETTPVDDDYILYAVFKKSEGGSNLLTAELTNEEICKNINSTSYSTGYITNKYGTWNYNACKGGNYGGDGKYYIQIRKNATTSYIQIPALSGDITSIVLNSVCNGSNGKYGGSLFFRSECDNEAEDLAKGTSSEAFDDVTLTIPAGHKTGYIMSSDPCRISSITVNYSNVTTTYTINEPKTQNVKISEACYATAFIPFNSTVEGATAYYVTIDGNKAQLNEIEGTIPAETGVVLKGAEGTATFTESAVTPTTDVSENKMVGSLVGKTFSDAKYVYYRLANKDGDVGFYKQNKEGWAECDAGKAVLEVPVTAAPSFFTFDDATAINAISNVKTSSVRYNLNGQAVGEDYKGIVIVNGKKMFNK